MCILSWTVGQCKNARDLQEYQKIADVAVLCKQAERSSSYSIKEKRYSNDLLGCINKDFIFLSVPCLDKYDLSRINMHIDMTWFLEEDILLKIYI